MFFSVPLRKYESLSIMDFDQMTLNILGHNKSSGGKTSRTVMLFSLEMDVPQKKHHLQFRF